MRVRASNALPTALTLSLEPVVELSDDQFFDLCARNRDLRIERTAAGELILMSLAGGETSDRNAEIVTQLRLWAVRNQTGRVFDASAGFRLPSGAIRAPSASWVERRRLRALPPEARARFLPLCPTFVVELRAPTDPLAARQAKMAEYLENGTALGWLIDPIEQRLHVYQPEERVEVLERPHSLSGEPVLPGFVLELEEIWTPAW